MAEENQGGDKTEEATPERREEFRKRGQLPISRDVTSVVTFAAVIGFLAFYSQKIVNDLLLLFHSSYEQISEVILSENDFFALMAQSWYKYLVITLPILVTVAIISGLSTFLQSGFNFSSQKLAPDFSRLDPIAGFGRMFGMHTWVELLKNIGKVSAIGAIGYLIVFDKWTLTPGLMKLELQRSFSFLGGVTQQFFWGSMILMLIIAVADYIYNFISLENKMKMSKEEVKQEFKNRELDPHLKQRMKRMARDIANSKMMEATKTATVVITNPTHYAVALRYELGMVAPKVVAKGIDHLALQMREIAKEANVPTIENPPVARALYALCKVGMDIPESLYVAISEVIKHVFKLKGIKVPAADRRS